jgi:hypothetical protein
MPVVGLITGFSADAAARYVAAFRKGHHEFTQADSPRAATAVPGSHLPSPASSHA